MKTSKKMLEVVTKIAQKHGLDLIASEGLLWLDKPGFDRLVIEKIGQNLVSVAHAHELDGDLVADPKIVFFIGNLEWVPIEIVQVIGGRRIYATLSAGGQSIVLADPIRQAELADFAEGWARNIETQGWLEQGMKWHP